MAEKELRALRELAARQVKAGDWLNAGAIYHAVLDEAVRGYKDQLWEIDEDGDISILIDEFALGLSQCLKKSKADEQNPHRRTCFGQLEDLLSEYSFSMMGHPLARTF